MSSNPTLQERFEGCLLGLAIGDALGGKFEAQSPASIRARFDSIDQLIHYPKEEIWYTDDTQMMIGVAEALCEDGEIIERTLCRQFVSNYLPSRGYGRGARAVLEAMEEGADYSRIAEEHFPGGSYGNGAAMRVAPVGLLFQNDAAQVLEQARLSALPTHRHPQGIEGAQLLALAVSLCSKMEQFDRELFFTQLQKACQSEEYRDKLAVAATVESPDDLAKLGNGIEAVHSVPTAIAGFALTPDSTETTIGNLIFLGGDTDTITAMGGALSGAYLGTNRLPGNLVRLLESSLKGRDYIKMLAAKLYSRFLRFSK